MGASFQVDSLLEELTGAMEVLRESMRGIPYRQAGFRSKHDRLTREVAHVVVLLEASRVSE